MANSKKIAATNEVAANFESSNDLSEVSLSRDSLLIYLKDKALAEKAFCFKTLASTNTTAKEMADNGSPSGTTVVADAQTAGRGRFSRTFYSPGGSGLYISFILDSDADLSFIVAASVAAVCVVLEKVCEISPRIKWVNDVFVDGRKVAGILAEAKLGKSGKPQWVVLGIGINITSANFPPELEGVAGALFPSGAPSSLRSRLAAALMDEFLSSSGWMDRKTALYEYRKRALFIGERILIKKPHSEECAIAVSLDDDLRLVVRKDDGTEEALLWGEVSVRAAR
ncbi:MAG: biotin--[acetyl-CoA-carboxylase] ligase [Clostridiales bacterium]|jgi:BirA family biotin operon repressor/biotin-[acetyl-CoA-carboxylase] ligase|nr:biotin--[acetyl-CoA-carboxylase] ligase [Clostridiales bacterium]